jgi:hypothetical protein
MLTWLRRIAACIFLTLAILFAALWVRSYFTRDLVARVSRCSRVTAESIKGAVFGEVISSREPIFPYPSSVYQFRSRPSARVGLTHALTGFHWEKKLLGKTTYLTNYRFPLWPVVLILSVTAIVILPKPRLRFSLFALFLLLTMVAISIGTIVAFVNNRGVYHSYNEYG